MLAPLPSAGIYGGLVMPVKGSGWIFMQSWLPVDKPTSCRRKKAEAIRGQSPWGKGTVPLSSV